MLTRRNALLAGIAFVAACSVPQAARPLDALRPLYARPAQDEWPEEFAALRPDIQEMYRYAVAHHDVLQYIPCFCVCVAAGPGANFDCYIRRSFANGGVPLDTLR